MLKVVVVDIESVHHIHEDISSVSDLTNGKLVLLFGEKVVAVYNEKCWRSWRMT